MKLKLLFLLSCVLLLSSCGNVETDGNANENYKENTEITSETVSTQETAATEEDTYILYDRVPEWDNIVLGTYAVQIDDTLYTILESSLDTFFEQLENSEVEYTHDYNPNRLIGADDSWHSVTVYRDGIEWFTVRGLNPFDKTTEASRLILAAIEPTDEAKKYCRFFDGRSYEDISNLGYSDIMNLAETTSIVRFSEKTRYVDDIECIILKLTYQSQPDTSWSGYSFHCERGIGTFITHTFYVNCDTGKVMIYLLDADGYAHMELE